MASRRRSRRAARAEPHPRPAEDAGLAAQTVEATQDADLHRLNCDWHIAGDLREMVLQPKRCSFLIPVPEQLMSFMVEAGFGHAIQLRDFAFNAPLQSAFVERWRP
ncbi:hypothetical protein PIB30_019642 [Stylosanthes scabra]|uniref:Uncharacterized protein n=1 Tax=Stylosanthes scabra TaxID=79078 RepID=A0ABU6S8Z4_9FABA|nr:hypothetical protein [Stylosanthes scabra]